ncbi:MAG: OmpH family outer membrane protein [Bacteroides sp.]|nr:OmpH family outer membrane protein [Bacteroides sp.]MDD2645622.1 OmpH family outer membrane protein [Bacteroides sp.]MDD4054339.1 OmpH family outer membrane protein [Bacteroides sp.]MDD4720200.1 OmpH family outer membrane protein [Bacteroides sp.]NLI64473.1 OmpH family outer membrane protein [Bacteroidales bacterium]
MKRIGFVLIALLAISITANAQRFALIDMEYILEHIPAYNEGMNKLDSKAETWQKEIQLIGEQAETMYKNYQNKISTLSDKQRKLEEESIIAKEKELAELRRKYFGPEGEMATEQNSIIQPIEDAIYQAVKELSETQGYSVVLDRASATSIIFASPAIDISNEVLYKLGYSN